MITKEKLEAHCLFVLVAKFKIAFIAYNQKMTDAKHHDDDDVDFMRMPITQRSG